MAGGGLILVAVVVATIVAMAASPLAAPHAFPAGAAGSGAAAGTPSPHVDRAGSVASPSPAAAPSLSASPEPTASPTTPIALVPVVALWSSERDISRADLAGALSTSSGRPVIVSEADLTALAAALGVVPSSAVRAEAPADVRAVIASSPDSIGVLRATDVTADVRALAVEGRSLFGAARVRTLDAWPLTVRELAATDGAAFDPVDGEAFDPASLSRPAAT